MSRFFLVTILAYFFVLHLATGADENSLKVACSLNKGDTFTNKTINLKNFSTYFGICTITWSNERVKNLRLLLSKESKEKKFISNQSKQNITLNDIIKSKIKNPKFSPNREHIEKIIFDETVAFIGDMRQLVTLNQRGEHVLYNFSFTESSLNLSDKKRFLVQKRKKNFVVLLNQANPNEKIIFYKKEGKGESIFYYVASGNLFKV